MMKVDKALSEVWEWKDEIYKINKGKSMSELVKFIKREATSVQATKRLKNRSHKLFN